MAQSRTLCLGLDVHKDALAVASVAQDHGAVAPLAHGSMPAINASASALEGHTCGLCL